MLTIIRHGECEANPLRVFHGWTDCNLTRIGYKQVEYLSNALKNEHFDIIYVSPLKRALESAKLLNTLQLQIADELKEINGGDWENKSILEIESIWNKEYNNFLHDMVNCNIPNGSNCNEEYKSLKKFVKSVLELSKTKNVAIVGHGAKLQLLISYISNKKPGELGWLYNASITKVKYNESDNNFDIISFSDVSHLPVELGGITKENWYKK